MDTGLSGLKETRPAGTARKRLLIVLGLFAFPLCGYGYLDLGSGSYIIQLVIAIFVGFSFSMKRFWRKTRARLSKKTKSAETRDAP